VGPSMDEVGGEDDEGKNLQELALPVLEDAGKEGLEELFRAWSWCGFAMDDGFIHLMLILEIELTDQRHDEETHENEAQQVIV
jgi:hypothetical protein